MYLNRRFDVIPPHLRILALLAAHTCAGNLTRVAIDWSYLPEVLFFFPLPPPLSLSFLVLNFF